MYNWAAELTGATDFLGSVISIQIPTVFVNFPVWRHMLWWLEISSRGDGSYFRMINVRLPWVGADRCGANAMGAQVCTRAEFSLQLRPCCTKKKYLKQVEDRNMQKSPWKFLVKPSRPVVESPPWRTVISSLCYSSVSRRAIKSCLFLDNLAASVALVASEYVSLLRQSGVFAPVKKCRKQDCTGSVCLCSENCINRFRKIHMHSLSHVVILRILFPKS